jgi:hypothetical protein
MTVKDIVTKREAAGQLLATLFAVRSRVTIAEAMEAAGQLGIRFALGDGTMTTWGKATVADHRQRIEMLAKNAAGVVETAARHEAAVAMISEADVTCLDELAA